MRGISIGHVAYMVLQAACKQCHTEIQANLAPATAKTDTLTFASQCSKCGNMLAVAYKFAMIHVNNKKDLGYIGLVGLDIKDVLPCNFKVDCAACDTTCKMQGVQAILDSYVSRALTRCRQPARNVAKDWHCASASTAWSAACGRAMTKPLSTPSSRPQQTLT